MSRAWAGLAVGTRVAGCALALVYLLGARDGSVFIVVGGLGLIAFGRVAAGPPHPLYAAVAFVVSGIGLAIPPLRWQLLALSELRGVQAVLGPTVLVEPTAMALSACVAALATLIDLGLGIASAPWRGWSWWLWIGIEVVVGALAAVTVYFGPAISGWGNEGAASIRDELAVWAGAVGVAAITIVGAAGIAHRLPKGARWWLLGGCGVAILVAAGVVIVNL